MLLSNSIEDPEDTDFKAFRDDDNLEDERNFIESLWKDYKPYSDSHFKDRFWEMYLGCSLMELGFSISSKDQGPDIKTNIEGKTTWFEAVAPGLGEGDDAVPDLPSARTFPEHELILRFTSAIQCKYQKLKHYIADGIVDKEDSFIIAINSSKISLAMSPGYPSHILKALFPLGNPIFTVDLEKRQAVHERFAFRPEVYKKSGQKIDTLYFNDDTFCEISGILYSRATPFYSKIGQDYFLIHNPYSSNPIPYGAFKIGSEAYADDEFINIKKWN